MDGIANSMDMSLGKFQENGEGQESLGYYSPWSCKELDTTEGLNNFPYILEETKINIWRNLWATLHALSLSSTVTS